MLLSALSSVPKFRPELRDCESFFQPHEAFSISQSELWGIQGETALLSVQVTSYAPVRLPGPGDQLGLQILHAKDWKSRGRVRAIQETKPLIQLPPRWLRL